MAEKSTVQLIIDGQQSKVSLKEMGVAIKTLKKELREMKEADDPKAYAEKLAALKATNQAYADAKKRVAELTQESKKFRSSWKEIMMGMLGGNAVQYGIQQLGNLVTAVKDKIYSMSDSMADVGRAAGLTKSELRQLNSQLSDIDTRTLNNDLRDIAVIAGKNGIQKDLAGFVKSTDMLNVALGDEFDTVTELTETVVNLRKIFQDIQSDNIEADVLHIGNAMNFLADAGTASAKTMADFASRMGGTLIPLGATSGQILGLATTMEELSITAERGSTAVSTIFQKMLTDVETFAKVAGVSTGEFEKMLNTDIWSAFNLFMVGAKKGGAQATEFAKILADVELSGAGASEVILKLSSNQDLLAGYVDTATQKLKESSAVTAEFNKKNNNAAAIMDKWAKAADNALESLALFGMDVVEGLGQVLGMVDKTADQFRRLNEQQEKVARMDTKLLPLLERYEQLHGKVNKTAKEQEELRKVTEQIGEIVPGAVTEWDSYGRAMDINAGKTREFYKEQKQLIAVMRQQRRDLLKSDLEALQVQAKGERNKLKVGKNFNRAVGSGGMFGSGPVIGEKYSDAQYQAQVKKVRDIEDQIAEKERDLAEILGTAPDPASKTVAPKIPPANKGGGNKPSGSPADPDKPGKAKKEGESMYSRRHKYEMAEAEYDKKRAAEKASYAEAETKYDQEKLDLLKERMEAEREFDQMMAEREARQALDNTSNALSLAEATGELTPDAANRAKLDAEEAYLMQLFMIRKSYGQQTDELEQDLAQASIDRARMVTESEKHNTEMQRQLALTLQTAKIEALEQGVSALKSYFKETSIIYKALFVVEKAAAIANVIIKAQAEIASTSAYAATLGPIAGPAYAAAMIAATKIRTGISVATIAAQAIPAFIPQRKDGGYTDIASLNSSKKAAGYVRQPTFFDLGAKSYVAGENYKPEYVIPNSMLQDPFFASQARAMETFRVTGKHPLAQLSDAAGGTQASNIERLLLMSIEETRLTRIALESGKIGVRFNISQFEEQQKYMDFIRRETSLG